MQGVPRGRALGALPLGHDIANYYGMLSKSATAFAFINSMFDSSFGLTLGALKANETRTILPAYDVDRFRLLAFTISAA